MSRTSLLQPKLTCNRPASGKRQNSPATDQLQGSRAWGTAWGWARRYAGHVTATSLVRSPERSAAGIYFTTVNICHLNGASARHARNYGCSRPLLWPQRCLPMVQKHAGLHSRVWIHIVEARDHCNSHDTCHCAGSARSLSEIGTKTAEILDDQPLTIWLLDTWGDTEVSSFGLRAGNQISASIIQESAENAGIRANENARLVLNMNTTDELPIGQNSCWY